MQQQQVFTQLVYNFLIYTLSPIYQQAPDIDERGAGPEPGPGAGAGNWRTGKRKPSLWEQREILL